MHAPGGLIPRTRLPTVIFPVDTHRAIDVADLEVPVVMSHRTLWIAAAAVVVTTAAIAFTTFRRTEKRRYPEITLPDGTVMRVLALTFGTNQAVHFEPPWWNKLKGQLPPAWHRFTGPPVDSVAVDNRDLLAIRGAHLWLMRIGDGSLGRFVFDRDWHVEAVTSDGWSVRDNFYVTLMRSGQWLPHSEDQSLAALTLPVMDNRAGTLRFRIVGKGFTRELSLPNPRGRKQFPQWNADPLPSTHEAQGHQVILKELKQTGEMSWEPSLEVHRDGHAISTGFDPTWSFSDATGNISHERLPALERAWKVDLLLSPTGPYPFRSNDVVVLGRLQIPGRSGFAWIHPATGWTNHGILASGASGPGDFRFVEDALASSRHGKARGRHQAMPGLRQLVPRSQQERAQGQPKEAVAQPGEFMIAEAPGTQWRNMATWFSSSNHVIHVALEHPPTGSPLLPPHPEPRWRPGRYQSMELVLRARRMDGSMIPARRLFPSRMDDMDVAILSFELQTSEAGETVELEVALGPRLEASWVVESPLPRPRDP